MHKSYGNLSRKALSVISIVVVVAVGMFFV